MTWHQQRVALARYHLEAAGWDRLDERAESIARQPFDVVFLVNALTNWRYMNAPPLAEALERMNRLLDQHRFS